jgi:hypothetical protein
MPSNDSVDEVQVVRPSKYATDSEWAAALTEQVWVLQDELDEARGALHAIGANVDAWRSYVKETTP